MSFDITVIIPTYNVEKYILEALDSVIKQTFEGRIEIIIVDDCSTDGTREIIEKFKEENRSNDFYIKILYQEKNMRQGTARNRALNEANGKYVFFLDGDDLLDHSCLDKMYKKTLEEEYDFVLCDWAYYYEDKGLVYVNNDLFLFKDSLKGSECEKLYEAPTYFSVNKLYSRKFLIDNNIKYGEGYIYEDFEFYLEVAQKANAIGIISNPLYKVRVNENSTTKTNTKSTDHITSYLKAVENSLNKFNPRGKESVYQVYKHLVQKSIFYSKNRAPWGYKRTTLTKVLSMLNAKNNDYHVPMNIIPFNHFLFRRKYVQNNNVNLILLVNWLQSKGKLVKIFRIAQKTKRKLKYNKITNFIKSTNYFKNLKKKQHRRKIEELSNKPIDDNLVLFLGFDYRYVGNSKYLFDYMINKNTSLRIFFVTKDKKVPEDYRVTPRSLDFYSKLGKAKVVIAESWLPLDFRKREGSYWIQLWHGTPYKKLLFDSHEYYISSVNRNHKKQKRKDISRWDYILSDSKKASEKFISAFAVNGNNIIEYGYPRVQWLKENQKNTELIKSIREKLNINENKKVILYVPTWRDYNYKKSLPDLSYVINLNEMAAGLEGEFSIINKDHSMGVIDNKTESAVIYPPNDIEVQELILIADIIISDYSSIIFDGLAVDKKFLLYINDFEKYSKARGVYNDLHTLLSDFISKDIEELINKIISIDSTYPVETYKTVKYNLGNIQESNSNEEIYGFIQKLLQRT